jgi:hypothetical protein
MKRCSALAESWMDEIVWMKVCGRKLKKYVISFEEWGVFNVVQQKGVAPPDISANTSTHGH